MTSTLFQKVVNREVPAVIVHEDDEIIAFKDKYPVAPIHILIVPKKPIPSVNDLTEQDVLLAGKLILTARKIALDEKLEQGYRLVLNCGAGGGQSVYHLHLHLLGGRQMHWPPG